MGAMQDERTVAAVRGFMQSCNAKAHKAGKPRQVVSRPAEIQDEHKEDQARKEQTSNGQSSGAASLATHNPSPNTRESGKGGRSRGPFHQRLGLNCMCRRLQQCLPRPQSFVG